MNKNDCWFTYCATLALFQAGSLLLLRLASRAVVCRMALYAICHATKSD